MIEYKWKSLKEETPRQFRVIFAVRAWESAPLFGDEMNMEPYTDYIIGFNHNGKYYDSEKVSRLSEKEHFEYDWVDNPYYLVDMSEVLAWFPAPSLERENRFWEEYEKNLKNETL